MSNEPQPGLFDAPEAPLLESPCPGEPSFEELALADPEWAARMHELDALLADTRRMIDGTYEYPRSDVPRDPLTGIVCAACDAFGHDAGSPECPQTEETP